MPGPTTEVLNDELREVRSDLATLRADVHTIALAVARLDDVRSELTGVKADVQAGAVRFASFDGEVRLFMRVATWAAALLVTTALTSGVAAVWWASNLTSEVRQIGQAVGKIETRLSTLEARQVATPRPSDSTKGE